MTGKFKNLGRDLRRDWQLYLFLLLPICYIIIFAYVPMGGLVIAFKHYSVRKGLFGSDWVGLDNFIKFFESYQFGRVMKNTLLLALYSIVASFPIPIIFALFLNSLGGEKFKKTVQTIVCLPHFISVAVMVGILLQVLHSKTGLYGMLGMKLFGSYPENLFASPTSFRHLYVWSDVWQGFGWGSIVYTAALANVPPEYHEAAQIDGATRFQRIIHVDLPTILPNIIIMLILKMGSIMSLGYEKILLMQNDLNLSASEVISTYVYQVGLAAEGQSDFSYATAIGFFNSIINLFMITLVNQISRKVSETSLW